jgi:hypothetical protein
MTDILPSSECEWKVENMLIEISKVKNGNGNDISVNCQDFFNSYICQFTSFQIQNVYGEPKYIFIETPLEKVKNKQVEPSQMVDLKRPFFVLKLEKFKSFAQIFFNYITFYLLTDSGLFEISNGKGKAKDLMVTSDEYPDFISLVKNYTLTRKKQSTFQDIYFQTIEKLSQLNLGKLEEDALQIQCDIQIEVSKTTYKRTSSYLETKIIADYSHSLLITVKKIHLEKLIQTVISDLVQTHYKYYYSPIPLHQIIIEAVAKINKAFSLTKQNIDEMNKLTKQHNETAFPHNFDDDID